MSIINQYKILHEKGKFQGYSLLPHIRPIYKLIKKHTAQSLLDYGCGKGEQYNIKGAHERIFSNWGIMPTLYDPGYTPFSKKPERIFDGVICTDVMEHIPEEDVDKVFDDIISYANKFVYLCISTGLAKKYLPDGRNCHVTIKNENWWRKKLSKYNDLDIQVTFVR